MGSHTSLTVDTVTGVEDDKVQVVLLGIGGSKYYWEIMQHESLLNSHHTHDNGVLVKDTARRHDGKKRLIILNASGNTTITLVIDGYILKINLRQPTEEGILIMYVN